MLEAAIARIAGVYALKAYLPVSLAARIVRNKLRRWRGKSAAAATKLPQGAWTQLLPNHPIRLIETAMRLVRPGGIVLWHDYGVWPGVTRTLDEIEAARRLGLVHVRGSSLVFWRAG